MNYKEQFIEFLVTQGGLLFGDFTLKSGRKCPYFLNIGKFNTGSAITKLGQFYAQALRENAIDFDIVFGPAYKGIPLSVATAMMYSQEFNQNVGFSFNRKEVKDHGEGGLIVGASLQPDSKVVIVDDVMTAGTALRESLDILKNSGNPHIQGVLIAVDRMEKGQGNKSAIQEIYELFNIPVYSIINLDDIVQYLYQREVNGTIHLDDEKMAKIKEYRQRWGV